MTQQSSLFSSARKAPLAERMRPVNLEEILGQESVVGPKSVLGQAVRDSSLALPSVLLVGPPGTGKTTIARVLAKESGHSIVELSGVLDGVAELREAVARARALRDQEGRKTLAVVDEIHRFNRSQQDAFLPHVESGLLTIIGLTTENVSFRLRNALLSRLRVVMLEPLSPQAVEKIIEAALLNEERGLGRWKLEITPAAVQKLVQYASGDARRALTALEWTATEVYLQRSASDTETRAIIREEDVESAFGAQPLPFDQKGDYHYDLISAFIKSMRGSDPDAALYYMVRALEGGEDPHFITRRMMIFASEDVSCDPRALPLAVAADQVLERIGLPEAKITLAHVATYLSCAPKSNASYKALKEVEALMDKDFEVPRWLRNAPTKHMKEMGNAQGYHYPHDYEEGFYPVAYLPKELQGQVFYRPTGRGVEASIREKLQRLRDKVHRASKS